jgi:hypothetical protein
MLAIRLAVVAPVLGPCGQVRGLHGVASTRKQSADLGDENAEHAITGVVEQTATVGIYD